MPSERLQTTADAATSDSRVELAVYPARVGRAGSGRPCSPSRAYRLPEDPARAAAAARTASSRRTVTPAELVLPPPPGPAPVPAVVAAHPAAAHPAAAPLAAAPLAAAHPAAAHPAAAPLATNPPERARTHAEQDRPAFTREPRIHRPKHLAPAPWYQRLALGVLRVVRPRR